MATKVQGLDKLKEKLRRLPLEAKREMQTALNTSADDLVAMQKRLAPVDRGDLVSSIEKVQGRHELSVKVQAGGPRAHHARWVEFGVPHRPATPYFFPAYRSLRKRLRSRITRASGKAARTVAAGGQ